jgi:hypothetical protein
MLMLAPTPQIRRLVRRRIGDAWHDKSTQLLGKREYLPALSAHLKSLIYPGGLRYIAYTRRLIPGWPN